MPPSMLRSRWAAIGAAVAVCLGAGGVGISHAVPWSGDQLVFVYFEHENGTAEDREFSVIVLC